VELYLSAMNYVTTKLQDEIFESQRRIFFLCYANITHAFPLCFRLRLQVKAETFSLCLKLIIILA
jgi:hypothetical protein